MTERAMAYPVTKPGYGEPEPMRAEPPQSMDTPENIATCMDCPRPVCVYDIKTGRPAGRVKCPIGVKVNKKSTIERRVELVREMLYAGWCDDAICEQLHISPWILYDSKRRLRERGEMA